MKRRCQFGAPKASTSSSNGEVVRLPTSRDSGAARFRQTTLDNGIRVVTERVGGARAVSIGVLLEVGTYHEPERMSGLAHFCEHLAFQGTSSRDARDIARLMDDAGGHVGGFTSRDFTVFYAHVLDDFATYALDLLGDILLNPVFPEAAVEREKRVISCEQEAAVDSPRLRAYEELRAWIWSDHPLGRPLAGSPDSVARITREDLIYFFHRNYVPQRVLVTAAGNILHEDFVAQTRDAFWRWMGEAVEPTRPPAKFSRGIRRCPSAVSQTYFTLGLPAPAYSAPERHAVHLLNQVLGGGLGCRLGLRLREEMGAVYDIESSYEAYHQAGLLSIAGATSSSQLALTLDAIVEELEALGTGRRAVNQEELLRAKRQLGAQILLGSDSTHSKMSRIATQVLYFGRCWSEEEQVAALEALTLDDLQACAASLVTGAREMSALSLVGSGPLDEIQW